MQLIQEGKELKKIIKDKKYKTTLEHKVSI